MDLTEKIFEINDIHQLVEQLSNIFQKAIIIEDKNFELIAYNSPNEFSFDPVQQKTILTKRCPLFIIERLKKEGIVEQLKRKNKPIRIEELEDIGFFQRVVISLKHKNKLYGYLWIYDANDNFKQNDFAFLTAIAPHLGKLLYDKQRDAEHDQQSVIWKLLNHEYLTQAEIMQEANQVSYTLPNDFAVFVASIKDANYLHILHKLKQLFMTTHIAYYLGKGTEIVGIIHGDVNQSAIDKTTDIVSELKKILTPEEHASLLIGIGNDYQHIHKIRKSYLEALEVIETMVFLNIAKPFTHHFHKLGMYRYIKLMYKKNITEQYRNKNIIQLIKKDAESNSELLKTLWYFLKNDCRVGQTAEQLFIHPNTMNYRIKQIVELTGIDFSNVHEKYELYTQLLIFHHVLDYQHFYKETIY